MWVSGAMRRISRRDSIIQMSGPTAINKYFMKNLLCLLSKLRTIIRITIYDYFSFGHTTGLAGSQFPDQGLNPGHSSESPRILTTRPPGDSQNHNI